MLVEVADIDREFLAGVLDGLFSTDGSVLKKQDNPLLALANADPNANIFLLPHIGSCGDIDTTEFIEFYGNVWNALNGRMIQGRI